MNDCMMLPAIWGCCCANDKKERLAEWPTYCHHSQRVARHCQALPSNTSLTNLILCIITTARNELFAWGFQLLSRCGSISKMQNDIEYCWLLCVSPHVSVLCILLATNILWSLNPCHSFSFFIAHKSETIFAQMQVKCS